MKAAEKQFWLCGLLFFLLSSTYFTAHGVAYEFHDEISRSYFPEGFFFGTSTSSYQIEGAYLEDGKGLSNWDVFCHIPGNIKNNENGDIADDHYHRYMEDIELIQSLGTNAYRFSIAWARILPRIEPFVALHHHDLPQELEDRYAGWLSPLIQKDFVHFAKICFESFGDRVKYWITVNEPNLYADMAYMRGTYPPAHCSSPFGNCSAGNSDSEPLIAMHNMLLSHALVVDLYRRQFQAKQAGIIGIIAFSMMYEPLRAEECDREAVNRALAFNVAWVLDPLVLGDYPLEMRRILGSQLPRFSPKEKQLIKGSLEFIGINHYSTIYVKDCTFNACPLGGDRPIRGFLETTGMRDGIPIGDPTGMPGSFVVPRGMEKMVDYMKTRYHGKPLFITENGYSSPAGQDKTIHDMLQDFKRIEFHKVYLTSLLRVVRKGADVRGYFIWSLMEWIHGYGTRFGLYYVDRQTLQRIPKLSAKWFFSFLNNISDMKEDTRKDYPRSKAVKITGFDAD